MVCLGGGYTFSPHPDLEWAKKSIARLRRCVDGTRDAGMGLCRKIRRVRLACGIIEDFRMKELLSYARNGMVEVSIATHFGV